MDLTEASILTAMVTPFDDQGAVDYKKLPILIEYLLTHHTEGLVVSGTTGESPTLSQDEALRLFSATVEIVAGRVPIICGVGSNNTYGTCEFIKKVAKIEGIAAGLVVVPYYNRPSQEGLYQHFKAVSEASTLPVMLYNVPSRTGINMEVETTLKIASLPNIMGTKDCSGAEALALIQANTPEDFLVFSGDDSMAFTAKTIGAQGIISVSSHVIGDEMFAMYQLLDQGKVAEAAKLHSQLLPKMQAVFSVPSPAAVKAVLNHRGIDVGGLRLPLVACTPIEEKNILMILNK